MQTERKLSCPMHFTFFLFFYIRGKFYTADWKAVLGFGKFFGVLFFSDSVFLKKAKMIHI